MNRFLKPFILWSSIILFTLIVLPLFLPSYGISLLTQILIFGLFAMSLDLLIGYTGLVSFNHATFFGVGAYTAAIILNHGFAKFWITLGIGIIVPILFALILGLIVLRSHGPYFLMITLAFGQMIYALAWRWRSVTGGDDGLAGIPRPDLGIPLTMWDGQNFYYLVLAFFVISFILLRKFTSSRIGRAVVGVRESESRMQALGYNTWALKYIAYALSAGFAGLAGLLYVYFNGFISPQELNWTMSGLVILMVIIGGAGTLIGPAVGASVIFLMQNLISAQTERWPLSMGIIFILSVMYMRDGIVGHFYKFWKKGRRKYECLRNHRIE